MGDLPSFWSLKPYGDIDVIKTGLKEVNKLLPRGLEVVVTYTELGGYCLELHKDGKIYAQLGPCVSKRQRWRIHERLLALYSVLKSVRGVVTLDGRCC